MVFGACGSIADLLSLEVGEAGGWAKEGINTG